MVYFGLNLLYFDFLSVDDSSVQLLDGVFGIFNVLHGDEGVTFTGDENIVHTTELFELSLKEATQGSIQGRHYKHNQRVRINYYIYP